MTDPLHNLIEELLHAVACYDHCTYCDSFVPDLAAHEATHQGDWGFHFSRFWRDAWRAWHRASWNCYSLGPVSPASVMDEKERNWKYARGL